MSQQRVDEIEPLKAKPARFLFAALEDGSHPAEIITAVEDGRVRLFDDFGRMVCPALEDRLQLRKALLKYVHFASERMNLGPNQSEACIEYFDSMRSCILSYENWHVYHQVPILIRAWLIDDPLRPEGFNTMQGNISALLTQGGLRARQRQLLNDVKNLAEEMILNRDIKMQHNQIAHYLLETRDDNGELLKRTISQTMMINYVKQWCKDLGRPDLIKGNKTRHLKVAESDALDS